VLLIFLAAGSVARAGDLYEDALRNYRAADYRKAIEVLSRKQPKDAGDFNLLGWAFLKSREAQEAKLRFEQSLTLDPGSADSRCGLGYAFLQLEKPDKALENFDKSISRDDRNVDCLLGKGLALEILHGSEKALETFRMALSMDKDNPVAREKVATLSAQAIDGKRIDTIAFFARGNHFWIGAGSDPPAPVFIKGVDLGFALPGKFPTTFPEEEGTYLEWFGSIREMNANLIRVYTILPPAFYRAVKKYNRNKPPGERLFLIQGIWTELPDEADFREPGYFQEVKNEIANAVDVIHGNAAIPAQRGHAHGSYAADVSDSVLGFIFGREWEPPDVVAYNKRSRATRYTGNYLSIADANPMEAWLTEMLDSLVAYEADRYRTTRPVAWMNWPPLDPLTHRSEATLREELEFRRKAGETVPAVDLSQAWDDDAVSIDETKVEVRPAFRGGLFSSYHVYPYYPDFLQNEEKYGKRTFPEGSSYYYNYLLDLKGHYRDIPLLVSEYGIPTSRGIGRFHPERLNHGGHNETEQADILKRLTLSIRKAGCAGGVVFSWIDEWVKTSWMAKGMEERDELWFNAQDPEESYGLIAAIPASSAGKVAGDPSAWAHARILHASQSPNPIKILKDGSDAARHLRRLLADADAGYLYLRLDVGGPVDWSKSAYLIAVDTYGTEEGDHALPFGLGLESPVGFEFAILLHGENSRILVDRPYSRMTYEPARLRWKGLSGYAANDDFRTVPNRDGDFMEIVAVHRRRFARDGTVFPEKVYNASPLRGGSTKTDSRADFHYSERNGMLELRIPWALLNVSDPSTRQVILSDTERRVTEGFRFLAASYKPTGTANPRAVDLPGGPNVTDLLPRDPSGMASYRWPGWDLPEYILRPKASYFVMKEVFAAMQAPAVTLHIPPGFDFGTVVKLHYGGSLENFLALYGAERIGGESVYGRGLSHLVRGLVMKDPFSVLEAQSLFAAARNSSGDPRQREIAELARAYASSLLSGRFAESAGDETPLARVTWKKEPPPGIPVRRVTIGRSSIRVHGDSRIRTQADRVTRDWLSAVNKQEAPWSFAQNGLVPWHEGEKVRELAALAGATASPVWGTRVKKIGNTWYAPDAEGIYRFQVSDDKVLNYPTTLVLDERTAVVNDTHGISAIAWDAADADLVLGCGDNEGKVQAAYYLADKGVDVYMPTDRFLADLIGTRTRGTILGSAPVKPSPDGAIIGDQPVTFDVDETIVVSDFDGVSYPLHYYDTPHRYFRELGKYLGAPLNIVPVVVKEPDGAGAVVEEARKAGAGIIGIRVWGKKEHDAVAGWLKEDLSRRAVLFHTAVYPEGYRLFFEFPRQTSFGDIHIVVE
jgi:tetratricopeptide (TPR) repeat protein